MSGSGTIQVIKCDRSVERFDSRKLAGVLWRVMEPAGGEYRQALELAAAMELYLGRVGWANISSGAVFEMSVKVLRRVGFSPAADQLEVHRARRNVRRRQLRIRHDGSTVTLWEKSWLCEYARRSWRLSRTAARIIAGQIEADLLAGAEACVSRRAVLERLNACVAAYGLADAVPVRQ